jgi:hypothetical protein
MKQEIKQLFAAFAGLKAERAWAEALARRLGCGCPSGVFDQVRIEESRPLGVRFVVEIGGRLLIGVTEAAACVRARRLLAKGRAVRDREGLNRFRLVFVRDGTVRPETEAEVVDSLPADSRLHVHFIDPESLWDVLDRRAGLSKAEES